MSPVWQTGRGVCWYPTRMVTMIGNYGRISLGCSMAKVFMRVLASRLGKFAEDRILTEA